MMTIKMQIEHTKETLDALKEKGEALNEAITESLNRNLIRLQSHIIREHLSAPPGYSATMLHHRTGNLIRSIHTMPAEQQGDQIVGEVRGAGPPAVAKKTGYLYGHLHEFGGSWRIPAHEAVRMIFKRGKIVGARTYETKEHTVTMPERSYMRSSLQELKETISQSMYESMKAALSK